MKFNFDDKKKRTVLLIILLVVTILLRLQNTHQTDFDSYWLHAMGESIELHEAALWVFHPTSLFGYYPLSYPSGTPFFLATSNTLMGTDMNITVLLTSIIMGIALVGFTFLLAKKFHGSWFGAYISALIMAFSPLIINYTAFNAAGRITVLFFVLPTLWVLLHWIQTKKFKYLLLALTLTIFAFFMHRTAQLLIVYFLALIISIIVMRFPKIWAYIKNHRHYKKYLHPRYEKSKYYLLLDLGILALTLIVIKITDLVVRGRFGENIERKIVEPITKVANSQEMLTAILIILASIIFLIGVFTLYLKLVKKKKIFSTTKNFFHREYHKIFENPQKYFLILLLIVTTIIFARQFFGQSFYSPSLSEFQSTEFLKGGQPYIIFANFIINYTSAVSPLFLLAFVGFIALLFRKKKELGDWFLIFIFIGMSGVLLDKKYVRLFIAPILSILMGYGTLKIYLLLKEIKIFHKTRKSLSYIFVALAILLIIGGAFIPYVRKSAFGEKSSFDNIDWYWQAGKYLRNQDCDCSTVTTKELTAGVVIFASSGIPGGSHNIYYFIGRDKLQPKALTFEEVKNRLTSGEKIENLWILPDWILGGQYYVGKHARYLFNHPFYDEINKIITDQYSEKFYIHDKNLEANKFLNSIEPVKNIVYDNPKTRIYEIDRGQE